MMFRLLIINNDSIPSLLNKLGVVFVDNPFADLQDEIRLLIGDSN